MNLQDTIKRVQAQLGLDQDGVAGVKTWTAIDAVITPTDKQIDAIKAQDKVDERSEGNIGTLLKEVQPYARALIHAAAAQSIQIKVISGTRTYAEQDALFAKRPQVTKARGGFSNHNFGLAFDIGVFEDGKYISESRKYAALGAIGKSLGLDWGGDWKTIVDEPHFQLRPSWAKNMSESQMLADLRERVKDGDAIFA